MERLGYLMNSAPYVEQTDHLKHRDLQECEQTGQPVKKVIDYAIQRYNGRTPVHLAASNGLWECLDILLKNGGNPNMVSSATDLYQTPLHLAATKGYAKCIQILLDHGADMELENTHRVTSLDLVRGKKNCEKVFLHAVAKVQIPSRTREQQQRVMGYYTYTTLLRMERTFSEFCILATRWTDLYQQTLLYSQNPAYGSRRILLPLLPQWNILNRRWLRTTRRPCSSSRSPRASWTSRTPSARRWPPTSSGGPSPSCRRRSSKCRDTVLTYGRS